MLFRMLLATCCLWLSIAGTDSDVVPLQARPKISDKQMACLVKNAHHEAKGEPVRGRLLVTQVVLNRAKHVDDLCNVVYAKNQFSWTSQSRRFAKIPKALQQQYEYEILSMYYGFTRMPEWADRASHFHATYVRPDWSHKFAYLGRIGAHRFYQQTGA